MAKQIEAEGGELVLRNKNGSVAIIPARHRQEVLGMLKDGCNNCLNDYISKLPKMANVAKDGTIVTDPPTKVPTKSPDGEIIHERKKAYTKEDIYPWEQLNEDKTLTTDISKLPTLPQDNKFQVDNTWMRNWIRQRPNQLATFTNKPNKLLDKTMLNLGTVKFRDHNYIRPDSKVPFTEGSYMPANHSIYFPTQYTKRATVIHELGHASKLGTNENIKTFINDTVSTDTKLPNFKDEHKAYYTDPDEIYSRIWELRRTLNYQPTDRITVPDLQERYKKSKSKNDLFKYLEDKTIVTLLNDLVSTQTPTQNSSNRV